MFNYRNNNNKKPFPFFFLNLRDNKLRIQTDRCNQAYIQSSYLTTYYFPPDASCNDVSENNYKAFICYINRLILNYCGLFTYYVYL